MAAGPHRWRRFLLWLTLALLLALLALAGYGWRQWQRVQQEQGIVGLDWQGLELGGNGLRLQRLEFEQHTAAGRHLRLRADGLNLAWRLHFAARPELPALQVRRLQVGWQGAAATAAEPSSALADLEQLQPLLAWLPRRIHIEQFVANLPCARGQCPLQGALELDHAGAELLPVAFDLQLQRQPQHIRLHGNLQGRREDLALQLDAELDGQPQLQLRSQLTRNATGHLWQGHLELPSLPDTSGLREWLGEWLSLPAQPLPELPRELLARADWQLQLAGGVLDNDALAGASGPLRVDLQLPKPWLLAGIGQLQGELHLDLLGHAGHWQARQLEADLQLAQPQGAWLAPLPSELRPQTVRLQVQPLAAPAAASSSAAPADTPLAMQLALSASGPLNLELGGELHAWLRPDWALQLQHGRLQANAARLRLAPLDARRLQADLRLDARLDAHQLGAQLLAGAQLRLARLDLSGAELQLEQLRSDPAGLQLQVALDGEQPGSFRLQGPLALRVGRLHQAQLQPQGWRWQGRLEATPPTTRLDGQLGNDAGLALDLQLQRPASGAVNIHGTLSEIGLAAGNPLAKTLRDWPALLELSGGRLVGNGALQLAAGSLTPSAELQLQLHGVGGIVDRSELSGLDARLTAQLRGQRLELQLPDLRLASLNPGVPLGPLQLRADYQAELAQPLAGRLQLWQADSSLLGGQLHVAPTRLDLARRPLQLPVQVRGLELAKLLEVYPAEGLSGSGTLDGELPVRIDREGLRIDQGQLQARPPGGVLQFRSERIRAFGQSNPALQLATLALEDFHYDQLHSQVSYDPQGKLLLVLRVHGRNPALEGGRPVNFTINLEEDVPSLLTSLQLGGRVNEAIQRRVQQRLQPRP